MIIISHFFLEPKVLRCLVFSLACWDDRIGCTTLGRVTSRLSTFFELFSLSTVLTSHLHLLSVLGHGKALDSEHSCSLSKCPVRLRQSRPRLGDVFAAALARARAHFSS
jgi:hypothetical protein